MQFFNIHAKKSQGGKRSGISVKQPIFLAKKWSVATYTHVWSFCHPSHGKKEKRKSSEVFCSLYCLKIYFFYISFISKIIILYIELISNNDLYYRYTFWLDGPASKNRHILKMQYLRFWSTKYYDLLYSFFEDKNEYYQITIRFCCWE